MKKSKLVIGISSRALFDLDESHKIFEADGVDAYREYQILNEEKILNPGNAFGLVKKILEINNLYESKDRVEVILLSRNSADTGLRVFNSIEAHNLDISRAVFSGGESPHKYVNDFNIDLFLSSSTEDVRMAIESNVASATIISGKSNFKQDSHLLKIAFDGDAVIFSDESEKIYQEKGISAFIMNETKGEKISLEPGPMKPFLMELNRLQREFTLDECPIRTALVTARSAPAHKRVIKTLREWGVRIDESLFLGGMSKENFLKSFQADIFFDDQLKNIQDASGKITSAHVPYGVKNEVKKLEIICLDMEGTLTGEIWQKVAEDTGIEDFAKTTRDIPSYSELMDARLVIMEKEGITLKDIQRSSSKVNLLDGARDFLENLRQNFQVVILSDTFHEIASPLMEKLGFPLLLCHTLNVKDGMITSYKLRQEKAKQEAIKSFQGLGYRCFAAGDSFNDIQMFEVCEKGFFINAPEKITSKHPEIEAVKDYNDLESKLLENSIYQYE